MSTSISSLSIRTTVPSTTSPCLKLLMSESCSARSSSIVVGSGPVRTRLGAGDGLLVLDVRGGRRVGRVVGDGRRFRLLDCRCGLLAGGRIPLPRRGPPRRPGRRRPRRRVPPRRPGRMPPPRRGPPRRPRPVRPRLRSTSAGAASAAGASSTAGAASGVASGVGSVATGSSATAIAATVCADAGASLEAMASGAGAVPSCCSSVKVVSVSCRGFGPWNHETASEHIPAPSWRGRVDRW